MSAEDKNYWNFPKEKCSININMKYGLILFSFLLISLGCYVDTSKAEVRTKNPIIQKYQCKSCLSLPNDFYGCHNCIDERGEKSNKEKYQDMIFEIRMNRILVEIYKQKICSICKEKVMKSIKEITQKIITE